MAGKIKTTFKKILASPTMLNILGHFIYWYAKFVYKTSTWEYRNIYEMFDLWSEEKSAVLVGWHGRIAMLPFLKHGTFNAKALVSTHKDGAMMAKFLKIFGIGIISGSSDRNPRASALSLMNAMRGGESIYIVPDGPKGPNMKMTISPLYFAQKSQKPIICVLYSAAKAKMLTKAWDNTIIPVPFSHGIFQALGPYYVPEDATEEDLKKQAQKIEDDMNTALLNIDKELGLPPVEIGKEHKKKHKRTNK